MHKEALIATESRIRELFKEKKIRSMFHLCGGNETELVELFDKIWVRDWVFSTHRSHYHALLKGMSPDELIDRVLKGESMHLYSNKLRFFTSSIVGGVLPIALGVAMSIKRKKHAEKVWVFIGDMCSYMGVFHECLIYAEGHDLPITFVIEDNGYCINTLTSEAWGVSHYVGGMPRLYDSKHIKYYKYERVYPHAGSGDFVDFTKP